MRRDEKVMFAFSIVAIVVFVVAFGYILSSPSKDPNPDGDNFALKMTVSNLVADSVNFTLFIDGGMVHEGTLLKGENYTFVWIKLMPDSGPGANVIGEYALSIEVYLDNAYLSNMIELEELSDVQEDIPTSECELGIWELATNGGA